MIDFKPLQDRSQTFAEFAAHVSKDDLYATVNTITDRVLAVLSDAVDADIAFEPDDPQANDPGASDEERAMGWNIGHVIVHLSASNEEAAMHALSLARGIVPEGRSRYETHWTTMTTVDQAQQRMQESRRMCIAMLDAWPEQPHLDLDYTVIPAFGPMNATARYILGLAHAVGHLDQIDEALRQSRAARA